MFPLSTSYPKRVGPRGQSEAPKLVAKATGAGFFLAGAPIISAHEVAQKILPYDPDAESMSPWVQRRKNSTVSIVKHIAEADYDFLDPILGPCWTSAMDTLIRELNLVETSWPIVSSAEVRNEIGVLLYAMTSLGSRYPLLAYSVAKVQKRLSGL